MKLDSLQMLQQHIADALYQVKAHELPQLCSRLGMEDGDGHEAFNGKIRYVKTRLLAFDKFQLLRIADEVLRVVDHPPLEDHLTETLLAPEYRITEITRRDLLKALNNLETLFGDVDIFDGLEAICPTLSHDALGSCGNLMLEDDIQQHYLRNKDYSNEELLIRCGALECTQTRFFRLIEKLLNPIVRRGGEQAQLATTLDALLKVDGYCVKVTGEKSKHPVYTICKAHSGVDGEPKNLIFAAINSKPDLYFTDAINNDIAIKNRTDALIYDRFIGESSLLWSTLVEWWQDREQCVDMITARTSLYRRLHNSVIRTASPGEYVLFETYYTEFFQVLQEKLPALVPQVYLHYDPRSQKQRGNDPVLPRQRMDLLLLLDNNVRIVIEVDGKQHYANGKEASPTKYAEMVAEDRHLRLTGYELYRFGGAEFCDVTNEDGKYAIGPISKNIASSFFRQLLVKHHVIS